MKSSAIASKLLIAYPKITVFKLISITILSDLTLLTLYLSLNIVVSSKFIIVLNVCHQKDIDKYREERLDEILTKEEFDKYGKLNNFMIDKPKLSKI